MHVIKAFFISLSIYSKIPTFQFEWKEEDMRYTLCFFPFVGLSIGILEYLWYLFCTKLQIEEFTFSLLGIAIPILITGGFHVDGFMDTMDAIHSYQPREKKLEILKDPHIGAFSVIMVVLYYLLYAGAYAEIQRKQVFLCYAAGFVLSRAFSALGVMFFPSAKKEGMLAYFSKTVQKRIAALVIALEIIFCCWWMFSQNKMAATMILIGVICTFIYYFRMSKKEFGGITGDLAGFFVTVCELVVTLISMCICLFV